MTKWCHLKHGLLLVLLLLLLLFLLLLLLDTSTIHPFFKVKAQTSRPFFGCQVSQCPIEPIEVDTCPQQVFPESSTFFRGSPLWLVNLPPPLKKKHRYKYKGFVRSYILRSIKGNQWLMSPDHKAGHFLGRLRQGRVDWPVTGVMNLKRREFSLCFKLMMEHVPALLADMVLPQRPNKSPMHSGKKSCNCKPYLLKMLIS